ncbi:MAG: DUF1761 domain-containing protein [Novosphingobium sp.]
MGAMDWTGIVWAGIAAGAVLSLAFGGLPRAAILRLLPLWLVLCWIPALMLGHALARIGAEKLAAKPQLYFMQSGGLALAFVIPALWLIRLRDGGPRRQTVIDSLAFLIAYLTMGAVFWVRA